MPSFDPNIMLGILQGQQSGQAFPTSIEGMPGRMSNVLERRIGGLNPDQLNTLTTGFQNYAPTWQQGQQWGRQDILGQSGFGGGNGGGMGGGMGSIMGGQMGRPDHTRGMGGFGGQHGGGMGGAGMGGPGGGLRGGGGK